MQIIQSARLSGFGDRVTVANNAVDSSRGEVEMSIDASNNGASYVMTKTQFDNPSRVVSRLTNEPKVKRKQNLVQW